MPRCMCGTQSHHRSLPRRRLRLTWRSIYLRTHRWLQKGWPEGPELCRARAPTCLSSRLSQTQTLESNVEAAAASRVGNPEPARRPQPRSGPGPRCVWCTKAVKTSIQPHRTRRRPVRSRTPRFWRKPVSVISSSAGCQGPGALGGPRGLSAGSVPSQRADLSVGC